MAMSKVGFKSARRDQGFDPIEVPGVSDQLRQNFERQETGIANHEKALADIRDFNVKQKTARETDEAELRLETVQEFSETAKKALGGLKKEYDRRRKVDALDKASRQVHTQQELEAAEEEYERAKEQGEKVQERAADLALKKGAAAKAVSAFKKLDTLQHIEIEQARLEQLGTNYELWMKNAMATNNTTVIPLGDGTTTTPMQAFKSSDAAATAAATRVLRREFFANYGMELSTQAATALGVQMNTVDAGIMSKVQQAEDVKRGIEDREGHKRALLSTILAGKPDMAMAVQRLSTTPGLQDPNKYMERANAYLYLKKWVLNQVKNGVITPAQGLSVLDQEHPMVKGKTYGEVDLQFAGEMANTIKTKDREDQQFYYWQQNEKARVEEAQIIENKHLYTHPQLVAEKARLAMMGYSAPGLKYLIDEVGKATGNGGMADAKDVKSYLMSRVNNGTWNDGLFELAKKAGYINEATEARNAWESPKNIAPLKQRFSEMEARLQAEAGLLYQAIAGGGGKYTPAGQALKVDLQNLATRTFRSPEFAAKYPDREERASEAIRQTLDMFEKHRNGTDKTHPFWYNPDTQTYPNVHQKLPYEEAGSATNRIAGIERRLETLGIKQGSTVNSKRVHEGIFKSSEYAWAAVNQYEQLGIYDESFLRYYANYTNGAYLSPFDLLKKAAGHLGIEVEQNPLSQTDRILAGYTSVSGEKAELNNPLPYSQQAVASAVNVQNRGDLRNMLNYMVRNPVDQKALITRLYPTAGPQLLKETTKMAQGLQGIDDIQIAQALLSANSADKSAVFYRTGDLGNMGGVAPHLRGRHLDVKRVDGGYFEYADLGKYIDIQDPEYGFVSLDKVPQTGDWYSHTKRGSHGRDYGTEFASGMSLKNGATVEDVRRGPNGEDIVTINTPEGKFEMRHGLAAESLSKALEPNLLIAELSTQLQKGYSSNKAWAEAIKVLLPNRNDRMAWLDNLIFNRAPGQWTLAMYQYLGDN